MRVHLTEHESRILTWTGKMRFANARANNRDAGLGSASAIDDSPEFHICGAHAEFAASIALNLYWRPCIGLIHEKDVGGKVETRSIKNRGFSLLIKPRDKDADPFVLVLQLAPLDYQLLGWRFAGDVKRDFPLRTDRGSPSHGCPPDKLDPMATLVEWLATRRAA
jgi:hypothetical protein